MSNLLIEEPPLQVLPSLALAVGLNEAIILQQMHYWLKIKQQASDKYADSFRDGRWWVYNSVAEWQAQFPFWSTDTIQRGITSLRKQGVLTVAQLSHDSRDRTNWYAIDYDKMEALAVPVFNERQSKTPRCGNALPQDAAMGKTQPATVHDRKMRQCLTETSSENTKRIPQRVAPAGASEVLPSVFSEKDYSYLPKNTINTEMTKTSPPAPLKGGAAFGAVSLSLLEQETVEEQEAERKRQERERSEAEWLVKVEEQKQKNADQKLFIKAFNQIAKEVKDNPPLSLAELDRLRTERHQKLKAEATSLTAEAAKGETPC